MPSHPFHLVSLVAGITWLALVLARPGLIARGTGWVAPPASRRWQNGWFWLLLGASALVLLGQIDTLAGARAPIESAGHLLWVVVVGRDVAHLMRGFRGDQGSPEALRAAIRTQSPFDRRTSYTAFFLFFVAIPAMLLLGTFLEFLVPEGWGPSLQTYVNALQFIFLWRCTFESGLAEKRYGFNDRWTDPGVILSSTLLVPFAVVAVWLSSHDLLDEFSAGSPFAMTLMVMLTGWGGKNQTASG